MRVTFDIFLERAKAVHGDKFSYYLDGFTSISETVQFSCPTHGEVVMGAKAHINSKHGCPECAKESRAQSNKVPFIDFLLRAEESHGDKFLYSGYQGLRSSVDVYCKDHEYWFSQEALSHLGLKHACPKCHSEGISTDGLPFKHYLDIRKDTYNFTILSPTPEVLVKRDDKVTLVCEDHGEQTITVGSFSYQGSNCPVCAREALDNKRRYSNEQWRGKLEAVSPYEVVSVTSKLTTLNCESHGKFTVTTDNHIHNDTRCPLCGANSSKQEQELFEAIRERYSGEIVRRDRKKLGVELDIYLPDINRAYEFNGEYWHRDEAKGRYYHRDKWRKAKSKGIRLTNIWSRDWENKKDKVLRLLDAHLLTGVSLNARDLTRVKCSKQAAVEFMDSYHIEGSNHGQKLHTCEHYSLVGRDGTVIMVASISNNTVERVCTLPSYRVRGGVSKLLKECKSGTTFFSTNDTGWGPVLPGWDSETYTGVRYWWYRNKREVLSRRQCTRQKIETRFGVSIEGKTEYELMTSLGYYRVSDSGLTKHVKT